MSAISAAKYHSGALLTLSLISYYFFVFLLPLRLHEDIHLLSNITYVFIIHTFCLLLFVLCALALPFCLTIMK